MKNIQIILIILISVISGYFWSYFFSSFNQSNITNINSLENNITSIVKKVSPWVVSIIIKKDVKIYKNDPWWFFRYKVWNIEKKIGGWTWFFISKDWIIITNKHVVEDKNAKYTVILNNWKEYDAKILAYGKEKDIAFLKITDKNIQFNSLQIINDNNLKLWEFSIAIWNALAEFQNSVSLWIVSWINRKIEDNYNNIKWLIQTDAAINPWNSWGPLLNLKWKVIWINTLIINWSQNLWFAISINQKEIDEYLEKLK